MKQVFNKPICFFDLEATSTDVSTAKIIDIAILKITNFGTPEQVVNRMEYLINPGCPITNSDIHHITDEMVKDAPRFGDVAKYIFDFIAGCDLAGFNIKTYDIPLLAEELARADLQLSMFERRIFDQLAIHRQLNPSNLSAVYKKYTGNDIDGAHRAMVDTEATVKIFEAQLLTENLPDTADELIDFQNAGKTNLQVDLAGKFIRNEAGEILFNFGQHKGKVASTQSEYLYWMVKPASAFTAETKSWCYTILNNKHGLGWTKEEERAEPHP